MHAGGRAGITAEAWNKINSLVIYLRSTLDSMKSAKHVARANEFSGKGVEVYVKV